MRYHEEAQEYQYKRIAKKEYENTNTAIIFICFLLGMMLVYSQSKEEQNWQMRFQVYNQYVKSNAIIVNPKTPLKAESEYQPVQWCQFGKLEKVDMSAFFITSGRVQSLILTLQSFFKFNTYPLKKVVVTHDGPTHEGLQMIMKMFPNITWIITTVKLGQLAAIDFGYQYLQTQYYFHSEDDWKYKQYGFIQYCLQAVQFDPKLSQMQMYHGLNIDMPPFDIGPLRILTQAQSSYSGFSFWSAVHTMSTYKLLKGGYNLATHNASFGKGVGSLELVIGHHYVVKGYHGALTRVQFAIPLPAPPSPLKYWGEFPIKRSQAFIQDEKLYNWIINNRDPKKLKKQVEDLLLPKFRKVVQQNPQCENFKKLKNFQQNIKPRSL